MVEAMAAKTSTGSGLFSVVVNAADGDDVTIASGHEVVFDVNQENYTTGIGIVITGNLKFKSDAKTCLKTKTNVNISGTGSFGNPITDPIQRPAAGDAYRCRIILQGTSQITVPNIAHYGWYPIFGETTLAENADVDDNTIVLTDNLNLVEGSQLRINCADEATLQIEEVKGLYEVVNYDAGTKTVTLAKPLQTARLAGYSVKWLAPNFTTLAADVSLNSTEIPLADDFICQQGDEIVIGSGNETGAMAEANKGVYTVQSYNAGTRTITLTSGVQTTRKGPVTLLGVEISKGDYVAILSRPTNIERTPAANTTLTAATTNGGILQGVRLVGTRGTTAAYWSFMNCSIQNGYYGLSTGTNAGHYLDGCTANNNSNGGMAYAINGSTIKNSISFNTSPLTLISVVYCYKVVAQNCAVLLANGTGCILSQCVGKNNSTADLNTILECTMYDGRLESTVQVANYRGNSTRKWINNESYDHNEQAGYYRAWMKGGYILTDDTLGSVGTDEQKAADAPHNPSNKFVLEEITPVFREFEGVYFPENKKIRIVIPVKKDFNGGVVKAQIVLPMTDTMIDELALPLAEDKMSDVKDTWEDLILEYKSPYTRPLTIRVYAQNVSGNVWVDTANLAKYGVERLLQPKKVFVF